MKQILSRIVDLRNYRWNELFLLILPSVFILLGMLNLQYVSVSNQGKAPSEITASSLPGIDTLGPQLLLIVALFATHIILSWLIPKADQTLLPITGMLSALGVLMATRLGPALPYPIPVLGYRQLIWVILGLVFCIGTVWFTRSIKWLSRYKYTWAAAGIILVLVSLFHSLRVKNFNSPTHDQLNLGFGGVVFQPSELLKLCLVIFFAAYLSENREVLALGGKKIGPIHIPPLRQSAPLLAILFISLLLFLGLRELGVALLIFGIFVSMIYIATNKMSYVLYSLGFFAGGSLIAYYLLGYIRDRVALVANAFLPAYANNTGFQIVQGLIALGAGGIFGQGLGQGYPYFVPAVQTDYVAAAVGEEFGMMGLFALLAIMLLLIYRGFRIAMRSRSVFEQLLGAGLSSIFAIQTIVILAGNLKLIPLTGIPLPFITYGGSSVIINFIMVGLLLRLSAPEETA